MTDRLAVVVPVFNEPGITHTLEALLGQREPDGLHVYVVDNNSTDDTAQRVRQFALLQAFIFTRTRSLSYIICVHLLFDFVLFLVLIHAHNRAWIDIFVW